MCVVGVIAVGVGRAGGGERGASDCRFSGRGGGQARHMYMCVVVVIAVEWCKRAPGANTCRFSGKCGGHVKHVCVVVVVAVGWGGR